MSHEFSLYSCEIFIQTLRLRAARERDELLRQYIYKYMLICIQFPDGFVLQVRIFFLCFCYFLFRALSVPERNSCAYVTLCVNISNTIYRFI